jgi:hypothetical protein
MIDLSCICPGDVMMVHVLGGYVNRGVPFVVISVVDEGRHFNLGDGIQRFERRVWVLYMHSLLMLREIIIDSVTAQDYVVLHRVPRVPVTRDALAWPR